MRKKKSKITITTTETTTKILHPEDYERLKKAVKKVVDAQSKVFEEFFKADLCSEEE